jgi:uncharacterized protein YbjT (DUF2867 family)
VRPTYFMEVWLSPLVGFDPAGGNAVSFGTGEQRISYISAGDVARFCAAVVNNAAAHGRILEIGGPAAVTPNDIIATAELTLGRKIAVQRVPVEALREQYENATDPLQRTLAGLSFAATHDVAVDMSALLREFPIAMRTVREHINQLIGTTRAVAGAPANGTQAQG